MPPAESPTQKNSAALPPTTPGQGPRDHQNLTPSKRRLMRRWTPQKGVTWTQRGTTVTPKAGLPTNPIQFAFVIFDFLGGQVNDPLEDVFCPVLGKTHLGAKHVFDLWALKVFYCLDKKSTP